MTDHIKIHVKSFLGKQGSVFQKLSSPQWFKVYLELFDDPYIELMSFEERWCFMCILGECAAQKSGTILLSKKRVEKKYDFKWSSLLETINKSKNIRVLTQCQTSEKHPENPLEKIERRLEKNILGDSLRSCALDIFSVYPKRQGNMRKADGLKRLEKLLAKSKDHDTLGARIKKAAAAYAAHCDQTEKTGTQFVMQFPTWVNNWEEWDSVAFASNPLKGMREL